jgi:predicted nucleotidyltransferase
LTLYRSLSYVNSLYEVSAVLGVNLSVEDAVAQGAEAMTRRITWGQTNIFMSSFRPKLGKASLRAKEDVVSHFEHRNEPNVKDEMLHK